MTNDELQKAAKAFVNARRKEAGLRATGKLPKGYRGSILLCPVAKALEAVGVFEAYYVADGVVILRSNTGKERSFEDRATAEFMFAFDTGEYPELVIQPNPIKVAGKVVP